MIGQMQGTTPYSLHYTIDSIILITSITYRCTGKYQLQVFPEAGHFIQEDQPAKTAQILVDFFKRNDRGSLVLPPKVADMQASAAMKKGGGVAGGIKRE